MRGVRQNHRKSPCCKSVTRSLILVSLYVRSLSSMRDILRCVIFGCTLDNACKYCNINVWTEPRKKITHGMCVGLLEIGMHFVQSVAILFSLNEKTYTLYPFRPRKMNLNESKTKGSRIYNTHLNFRNFFSGKKFALYTHIRLITFICIYHRPT